MAKGKKDVTITAAFGGWFFRPNTAVGEAFVSRALSKLAKFGGKIPSLPNEEWSLFVDIKDAMKSLGITYNIKRM